MEFISITFSTVFPYKIQTATHIPLSPNSNLLNAQRVSKGKVPEKSSATFLTIIATSFFLAASYPCSCLSVQLLIILEHKHSLWQTLHHPSPTIYTALLLWQQRTHQGVLFSIYLLLYFLNLAWSDLLSEQRNLSWGKKQKTCYLSYCLAQHLFAGLLCYSYRMEVACD